nr:hypothetical protein [Tanacetum cinerariifolium]
MEMEVEGVGWGSVGIVEPSPSGGHTPGSDEGRPNLLELMNICTTLSNRVLALEEAKATQDKVITRLKLRVRRLKKKRKARTSQPMKRRLFKARVETFTDKSLAERAEAIRNKPPTITQVRNMMITYLKHMGNYTHQQLKHKTLEELQMLYEREKKWIDGFVPMDSEKEEKKSVEPESKDKKDKRIKKDAYSAPKQKSSKKQKMMQEQKSVKSDEEESADYEQENKELRMCLTVVSDEEETVDPEILSTKYPIVD